VKPQDNRFLRPAIVRALEAAADVLFDPRIAADFVSFRMQSEEQTSTFPGRKDWAFDLSWMTQSGEFVAFLSGCVGRGRQALDRMPAHVQRHGIDADREERRAGVAAIGRLHAQLRENTEHPAWVCVVFVALGRLIASEASRAFASDHWSEGDSAYLDLDKALTNAAADELERLLLHGPVPVAEFIERIGDGVPEALGVMVALGCEGILAEND
jgi:hypothetical protein